MQPFSEREDRIEMTDKKLIRLTENQFDKKFNLIKNPFEETGWDGYFFEIYGQDLEYVRKQNPANIWTFIDGDRSQLIISGYHLVNRINYLLSIQPVPDDIFYEVIIDDDF